MEIITIGIDMLGIICEVQINLIRKKLQFLFKVPV